MTWSSLAVQIAAATAPRSSCRQQNERGIVKRGRPQDQTSGIPINVIAPYRHLGMWVFDDPRVGLHQEPFVAGADTWIDRVVAGIPNADRGFTMIFSAAPFPGHQHRLDWVRAEDGGNWYRSVELDLEGWLCPALFRYFAEAPERLYVQIKAR